MRGSGQTQYLPPCVHVGRRNTRIRRLRTGLPLSARLTGGPFDGPADDAYLIPNSPSEAYPIDRYPFILRSNIRASMGTYLST